MIATPIAITPTGEGTFALPSMSIATPTASRTVELTAMSACLPDTAMEMTRPWTSQNDVHRRLEISHRTRDFHIPTAAYFHEDQDEDEEYEREQTGGPHAPQLDMRRTGTPR
jgi:hypothetical protein